MANTYGPNVPLELAKIFSDAVLRVGNSLGVNAIPTCEQRDNNCIFIRIKSNSRYQISLDSAQNIEISGRYLEGSTWNINTTGLDFHTWQERFNKDKFSLSLQVGIKNGWYNDNFLQKLKKFLTAPQYQDKAAALLENYEGCTVWRTLRVNKKQNIRSVSISSYNSLIDYINAVNVHDAYRTKISKQVCINKLQSLGIADNHAEIQRLRRWTDDDYNYLEQFSIVPPEILCLDDILAEKPDAIAELERQIKIQIRGMIIFDWIFQNV